jgi:hypothetical protein
MTQDTRKHQENTMNLNNTSNQDKPLNPQTLGQNQQGYRWGSYLWAWDTTGFDQWRLAPTSNPDTFLTPDKISGNQIPPSHSWFWKGDQLKNQIPIDSSGTTIDYEFPQPQGFFALSPWVSAGFPAQELLVSWNTVQSADLVVAFWLQVDQLDQQSEPAQPGLLDQSGKTAQPASPVQPDTSDFSGYSSQPWFCLGTWTSDPKGPRGSVKGQAWQGTRVLTDTLRSATPLSRIRVGIEVKNQNSLSDRTNDQTQAQLTTPFQDQSSIVLNAIQLTWSSVLPPEDPDKTQSSGQNSRENPSLNSTAKPCYLSKLPACSQMVYPDGGSVWCSPVSLAMVLEYWNQSGDGCKEIIFPTRDGVYDPVYQGYGNWVFNTAWAGQLGYRARVLRSGSLADLEPWLLLGIPLILSVAWNQEKGPRLTGAPIESSNGHLTVIAGFDDQGNPIIHEPASASNQEVVRTYQREQLEQCWLMNSGGTFYAVYPESISPPW